MRRRSVPEAVLMPPHDSPASSVAGAGRGWLTRPPAFLVILLPALLLGGLMLFHPGVRSEVTDSVTRRSPQFAELYFNDLAQARRCTTAGGVLEVDFSVRSRFDADRSMDYQVTTVQAERLVAEAVGSVATEPDQSHRVVVRVAAPERGDYTLLVQLVGQDNLLRLHCRSAA